MTPAQGGTGTTTVFTQGSVVFAGAAGVYSQDNATLFHDDTGNKNGVGTNLPSATLEVADTTVLAAESLTNPNLTGGASWTVTGGFALAANAATYTHATGVGTLNQASGTLAIAGVANALYSFTYTISNLSAFLQVPVFTITTGFALTAVPLTINQAGTYTVIFRAAAVPGNFVINVTSNQPGALTIDTLSLKRVIGGNLIVNGNSQINGTETAGAFSGPLTGNVTGNVSGTAATVTGAAQSAITSVGTLSGLTVTAAPTFSALTPGSIPFAGAAGLLSQDNTSLFWDATNKWLLDGAVADTTGLYAALGRNLFQLAPHAATASTLAIVGAATDTDTIQIGSIDFDSNDITTPASRRAVLLSAHLSGVTAGNKGGYFRILTKADNGSLVERFRVDNAGMLWNAMGTASPTLGAIPGVIFTQTANKATTANTLGTLFSTGVGSLTLPANLLIAGRTIRLRLSGFISVADGGVATHTLTLFLGGVSVATGTTGATFQSVLNAGWDAEALITCRTAGAGGTVIGTAKWLTEIATATPDGIIAGPTSQTTAACNTTGTLLVDLQFNNGHATGTITTVCASVEILN